MTIRKKRNGNYLIGWRNQELRGKASIRADRPKRPVLPVRAALQQLGVRYCPEISFWSNHHRGKQGNLDGGFLWVDFVIRDGKKPLVVILDDPRKRYHRYEKKYLEAKKQELTDRGIPYILLPVGMTSQEYWLLLYREMKKKGDR